MLCEGESITYRNLKDSLPGKKGHATHLLAGLLDLSEEISKQKTENHFIYLLSD